MTIEEYIDNNRTELLQELKVLCPNNPHTHDEEIEKWVLHTPHLYYAAQLAGVEDCQEEE